VSVKDCSDNIEMAAAVPSFLMSVVLISLSGVMMPGPVFSLTIIKGYKNWNAGALIALGHGVIEFPLMALIYFGLARLFVSDVVKGTIGLIGGSVLVYMGIQITQIMPAMTTSTGEA